MRLIDADALEELFREVISGIAKRPNMNGSMEHMIRASAMVIEMIKDAPTIEPHCETCEAFSKTRLLIPQPQRKKGKWIKEKGRGLAYKCSVCGNHLDFRGVNNANFCPNCGAEMREDGATNADVES